MRVTDIVKTMAAVSVGVARDRWWWSRRPVNDLTRAGVEQLPEPFLSKDECSRLVDVADRYMAEGSRQLDGDAYLVVRREHGRLNDLGVRQIMNAQDVDPGLSALYRSGRIESIFAERLDEDVVLESVTLQVDEPDDRTKRGFHVDRVTPPVFKLFVYLTAVDAAEHGPFTYVPGSHVYDIRRLRCLFDNLRGGGGIQHTDMTRFADSEARTFVGQAGSAVLGVQSGAHKGWHGHIERTRYCLIAYLIRRRDWSGRPFTLGRELVRG